MITPLDFILWFMLPMFIGIGALLRLDIKDGNASRPRRWADVQTRRATRKGALRQARR